MQYDEFVGQVQHRGRMASGGEAVHAIHATLHTLGERLYGREADHLAAQLPPEIGAYLREVDGRGDFSVDEFLRLVAMREGIDFPVSVHHARAVISVLKDAVSKGEIDDVLAQLPDDYDPLFQSGSEGRMDWGNQAA